MDLLFVCKCNLRVLFLWVGLGGGTFLVGIGCYIGVVLGVGDCLLWKVVFMFLRYCFYKVYRDLKFMDFNGFLFKVG